MKSICFLWMLMLVICFAPCALADSITVTGTEVSSGTGFGNTHNVLTLQENGSESGSIIPPDTETLDAMPTSQTYTAQQLIDLGYTAENLEIIFNPNETGTEFDFLELESFSLDFYRAGQTTPYAQTFLTNPGELIPVSTGQGSSGWLLDYTNTGVLADFFLNPTNILGASASILNTFDGPDDFRLIQRLNGGGPEPIPEPSTLALLGLGLVGLAAWRKRK